VTYLVNGATHLPDASIAAYLVTSTSTKTRDLNIKSKSIFTHLLLLARKKIRLITMIILHLTIKKIILAERSNSPAMATSNREAELVPWPPS
jgi:hypothetical protein